MVMKPIDPHTTRSQNGDPSDLAISEGVRKMPTPMTSPITMAVAETEAEVTRRRVAGGIVRQAVTGLHDAFHSSSLSEFASSRPSRSSRLRAHAKGVIDLLHSPCTAV